MNRGIMKIDTEYFHNLYIFSQDMEIYKDVVKRKRIKPKNISELYRLNLLLCRELYLIMNVIETVYKNKLHQKMTEVYKTENWFNLIQWQPEELKFFRDAVQNKQNLAVPVRILNDVSLKFWVRTFEEIYENMLFVPAIMHLFPNYDSDEPFRRSTLRNIFLELLNYRNNIAHCHVIIHEEYKILKYYQKFMKLIYWMDKDYYDYVAAQSQFVEYYNQLVIRPNPINKPYFSLQYSVIINRLKVMRKHPDILHIKE